MASAFSGQPNAEKQASVMRIALCFGVRIGALTKGKQHPGIELPILRAGFQTTDCYYEGRIGLDNSCGVREPR
jgi:hypothetical protein